MDALSEPMVAVVDGRRLAYRRGGAGPPVLYLHDAGADTAQAPLLALLAEDYDVVVVDLPGYGASDPPGRPRPLNDARDVAAVLAGFVAALDWPACTVVGTSLGGWFAVELALARPDLVRALVLCDAAGLHTPEDYLFALFAEGRAASSAEHLIADALRERLPPGERDIAAMPAPVAAATIGPFVQNMAGAAASSWHAYTENPALVGRLGRIACPAVVLWGERDSLIPLRHGQRFADEIPGARLEIVPGAGHLLALEAPEVVRRAVRAVH